MELQARIVQTQPMKLSLTLSAMHLDALLSPNGDEQATDSTCRSFTQGVCIIPRMLGLPCAGVLICRVWILWCALLSCHVSITSIMQHIYLFLSLELYDWPIIKQEVTACVGH